MKTKPVPIPCFLFVAALTCFNASSYAATSAWQSADHIKVRLVSDVDTLAPDTTFHLGLELLPDQDWHVYWLNPGDSGMPISVEWTLAKNVQAVKQIWPIPEKIPFGHLTNYGYEGQVIVPTRMHSNVKSEDAEAAFSASARWLVCKESCIPGSANLSLSLPVSEQAQASKEAATIQSYAGQEAKTLKLMSGQIAADDTGFSIELFAQSAVFKNAKHIEFFPVNESLFEASDKPEINWKNNYMRISQKRSDSFLSMPESISGLLVLDHELAWLFSFTTNNP